jgi:hypothetical protein
MTAVDLYLVRAHQQELLRAACLHRPGHWAGRTRGRRS